MWGWYTVDQQIKSLESILVKLNNILEDTDYIKSNINSSDVNVTKIRIKLVDIQEDAKRIQKICNEVTDSIEHVIFK